MSKVFTSPLVLLMFYSLSYAMKSQDSSRVKYINNIGAAAFFSPDYTSAHLAIGTGVSTMTPKQIVKPGFGYTSGINFIYYLKKGWAIQSGFSYSKWQYKDLWEYDYVNSQNFNVISEKFTFTYYSIPLHIRYTCFFKKFSLFFYTGLSRYKIEKAILDGIYYIKKNGNFDRYVFDITSHETTKYAHTGGIGINLKLTKKLDLFINPELRTMRREHALSFRRLHSWGLNVGLSYVF